MSIRYYWRLFAAAGALLADPARAEDAEPYEPVYRAWAEAGVLLPQSADLSGFPGSAEDSKLDLNPGFRVGLGSGYAFTRYFSVDWEVALLGSSVKDASGLDEMDATITQVPFLVNATLQYENHTGFTPFVGVGIGGAASSISIDEARLGATTIEGSDYDFVFAWQLAAGLKYAFNERLGIGVLYKFLWTADAAWELEDNSLSGAEATLELNGLRSHAILAFLSYRF